MVVCASKREREKKVRDKEEQPRKPAHYLLPIIGCPSPLGLHTSPLDSSSLRYAIHPFPCLLSHHPTSCPTLDQCHDGFYSGTCKSMLMRISHMPRNGTARKEAYAGWRD